jgi:hypothetical protein
VIPRTIHYCWFGPAAKDRLVRKCLESWRRQMPGYRIVEWNEANSPLDLPYLQAARARREWSRMSNYVRLLALHREGGVYFDTDIEALKPFDALLAERCFLGFQVNVEQAHWVNNAVLGAEAGHPFLSACMDLTLRIFEQDGTLCSSPVVTTRVLRDLGLTTYGDQTLGDVRVFPTSYFYPHRWTESLSPDHLTENTYCIHHWTRAKRHRWRRLRRRLAQSYWLLMDYAARRSGPSDSRPK